MDEEVGTAGAVLPRNKVLARETARKERLDRVESELLSGDLMSFMDADWDRARFPLFAEDCKLGDVGVVGGDTTSGIERLFWSVPKPVTCLMNVAIAR